jgi:phosphoribosylamine--glycine ligase
VKVLLVGQGGREHALAWKLARSPSVSELVAAPGNPGIAEVAACEPIDVSDTAGLAEVARRVRPGLVVVGPELPLVGGLADELWAEGIPVFGPGRDGARIEGSKAWANGLCELHDIPHSRGRTFYDASEAESHLHRLQAPFVVKLDGLAAGKGVVVTQDREEAVASARRWLRRTGDCVVVEEFLEGQEVSALAITDGRTALPLELARDYKRLGDGDAGPNTGGMGAHSPVPFVDDRAAKALAADILQPTVDALAEEGIDYRGILYAGLMLTPDGPRALEFNCRFGDPETQVLIPRLEGDLGELLLAAATGDLAGCAPRWTPDACVGVVLASEGYPEAPRPGAEVAGLDRVESLPDVWAFHAGTSTEGGRVLTSGGRVLTVSAVAPTLEAARERAYEACSLIEFEGMQLRTDIAREVS